LRPSSDLIQRVREQATSQRVAELIGAQLKGDGMGLCPLHEDHEPSFKAYPGDGGWKCFSASCARKGGDGISLWQAKNGGTFFDAIQALADALGLSEDPLARFTHGKHGRPAAVWEIRDTSGDLVAYHVRFDMPLEEGQKKPKKQFSWSRSGATDPKKFWSLDGMRSADVPLYGTQALLGWIDDPSEPIFVVEGEKAADALSGAACRAMGTVTGATSSPSRKATDPLAIYPGRIVLWPDAEDLEARRHMERIGAQLIVAGASDVALFTPDGLERGDDAVEWLKREGGEARGRLLELVAALPKMTTAGAPLAFRTSASAQTATKTTEREPGTGPADDELAVGGVAQVLPIRKFQSKFASFDTVQERGVQWFLPGWFPRGAPSLLAGEGGIGKGTLMALLAASISTGQTLMGEKVLPGRVLILSPEEAVAEVIKPRLLAAGANMGEVFFYSGFAAGEGFDFTSRADQVRLRAEINEHRASLVIADPIANMMGRGNPNDKVSVTNLLARIHFLGNETGCTFLVVHHFNKGSIETSGNEAWVSASRSAAYVYRHPAHKNHRCLAHRKSNYSALHETITLRIEGAEVGSDLAGEPITTTRMAYVGVEARWTLAALQADVQMSASERVMAEAATEWLKTRLRQGAITLAAARRAGRGHGFTYGAVTTASLRLGCVRTDQGDDVLLSLQNDESPPSGGAWWD